MIRIAINGAGGRMGRRIVALAAEDARFEIAGAVEAAGHPAIGADCGTVAGIGPVGVAIGKDAQDVDAIIDFSTPIGTEAAMHSAIAGKAALVTGTTGLDEDFLRRLRDAGKKIGVFRASNFGLGIAALRDIAQRLARTFPNADIEIVEAHHRAKIDSPSGTAIDIARSIAETRDVQIEEVARFGRNGAVGPRSNDEIGVHSIRGGGIVGDHRIIFAMPHETIAIEHRAISRDLFAAGALEAAAFVFDKIGFFGMDDLISIEGEMYA